MIGASLSVRPGEIVGVAGVSGNGQKELVQILAGQRDRHAGSVRVGGHAFRGTRRELERWGVSLLIEEPLANAAVRFHVGNGKPGSAAIRSTSHRNRWIRAEAARVTPVRARTDLALRHPCRLACQRRWNTLSGGNIQRTVLARELARAVRLLIMQNPCFGLDVAAAGEIRRQIARARRWGCSTADQRGPR